MGSEEASPGIPPGSPEQWVCWAGVDQGSKSSGQGVHGPAGQRGGCALLVQRRPGAHHWPGRSPQPS